jgi:hypothetical protein
MTRHARLDPRFHRKAKSQFKAMDCRVKPGNDDCPGNDD